MKKKCRSLLRSKVNPVLCRRYVLEFQLNNDKVRIGYVAVVGILGNSDLIVVMWGK